MCGRGPALWLTTPLPVWGRVHVGSTARPGSPERAVPAGGAPPRLSPLRLRFRDRPRRCPQVLWPYLLEFVTPVRFTGALTPLCRSLMHLAQKRQEAAPGALLIQYDGNGERSPRRSPDPAATPAPAPRPRPGTPPPPWTPPQTQALPSGPALSTPLQALSPTPALLPIPVGP